MRNRTSHISKTSEVEGLRVVPSHGFTMVELVVVIMLLGILSIGTVRFIGDATDGFAGGSARGELSAGVRQSVQHLGQALREALPNSIRVTAAGDCLEYVPVINASVYVTAPIGLSGSIMQIVPFDSVVSSANWHVVLTPNDSLYAANSPGPLSPLVIAGSPNAENLVALTFASAHQFSSASPQQRFFVVEAPVSYCLSNNTLYRYQNYGFQNSQPTIATLPNSLPNRNILMGDLSATLPVFATESATLTRNAVVSIELEFTKGGQQLDISHSVQIRNQI